MSSIQFGDLDGACLQRNHCKHHIARELCTSSHAFRIDISRPSIWQKIEVQVRTFDR